MTREIHYKLNFGFEFLFKVGLFVLAGYLYGPGAAFIALLSSITITFGENKPDTKETSVTKD